MEQTFKRDIRSLAAIFAFVERSFAAEDLAASLLPPLSLAIEEIFINCVKHNPDGRGDIRIRVAVEAGNVVVQIIDPDARPFDVTNFSSADAQAPLEERRIGGLGVHLARQMVDRLEFDYANGQSTVTLIKMVETNHV